MKGRLRFLNPIASGILTLGFLILNVSLAFALFYKIILKDALQAVVFGTLLFFFLVSEIFVMHVACWRFYKIDGKYIESGGFLRRTKRICLDDITAINKEHIVVFHGNISVLLDEVYKFCSNDTYAVIEINETTEALTNEITKRNKL